MISYISLTWDLPVHHQVKQVLKEYSPIVSPYTPIFKIWVKF